MEATFHDKSLFCINLESMATKKCKDLCGQVEDFGDDMRPNLLYSSFWTSTIIAVKGHSS